MAVLVLVLQALLVEVGVGVHVITVTVLVLVFDVLVLVVGVDVLVHGTVGVLVGVFVAVLTAWVGHWSSACSGLDRRALGAVGAGPDDWKVSKPRFVAESRFDLAAYRIELRGVERLYGSAALTVKVLPLPLADEHVQTRSVSEVDVTHEPVALEHLEVPVDGCQLDPQAAGEALGGHWAVGREQGAEHQPA